MLVILVLLLTFSSASFAEGETEYQYPSSGTFGEQGDNASWSIDDNGKMTVSGTGAIKDATSGFPPQFSEKIKELEVLPGITHIGNYIFSNFDNLIKVTLHEGLQSIGAYAFYTCRSLETFAIPDSVTEIGDQAFNHCIGMDDFIAGENNQSFCAVDGVLFTKDMQELVAYPAGNRRTSYIVPDGVKLLRMASFRKAKQLLSITLPDSLDVIEPCTFQDCFLLNSIRMPKTLRELGTSSFVYCYALTSIEIPEGVKTIYTGTFYSCSLLRTVHIPHSVTRIEAEAFSNCNLLGEIYYNGTAAEWDALDIQGQSMNFYTASMHFAGTDSNGGLFGRILSTLRNYFHALRRYFEQFFKMFAV